MEIKGQTASVICFLKITFFTFFLAHEELKPTQEFSAGRLLTV